MRKLSDILKEWDANRSQRQNLLTEFLAMTEDKTAIDLSNALGHHTSLLFARFIAALRLNYNNQGVGLLLDAINRFTGATGGTFDVPKTLVCTKLIKSDVTVKFRLYF